MLGELKAQRCSLMRLLSNWKWLVPQWRCPYLVLPRFRERGVVKVQCNSAPQRFVSDCRNYQAETFRESVIFTSDYEQMVMISHEYLRGCVYHIDHTQYRPYSPDSDKPLNGQVTDQTIQTVPFSWLSEGLPRGHVPWWPSGRIRSKDLIDSRRRRHRRHGSR